MPTIIRNARYKNIVSCFDCICCGIFSAWLREGYAKLTKGRSL